MTALILGGAGMLGHRLWLTLRERQDVFVTLRKPFAHYAHLGIFDEASTIADVNATNDDDLRRALDSVRPSTVYNCVGIVKQRAESHDALQSIEVNALLPHRLASLCHEAGARLVHLSTDCVYSGLRGNYAESDLPDPADLYGRSKLLGEVDAPGCMTIRTSMIGSELGERHGLLEWFLAQRGSTARGFTRAVFSGFTTLELARVLADVGDRFRHLEGLWHVSADAITKFDLLTVVNDVLRLGTRLEPDSSFVCDRSLDSTRFRRETGYTPPSWREMIEELAANLSPQTSRMPSWTSMESTSS